MTTSTEAAAAPPRRVLVTTSDTGHEPALSRRHAGTARAYVDALVEVGLVPLLIPTLPAAWAEVALDGIDGVVFTGGGDVDPSFFGEDPHPKLGQVELDRDHFELALYRAARRNDLPILGVCRGIQLIAVAEGGSVVQHLEPAPERIQHEQDSRDGEPFHRIRIEPDSALAAAFGRDEMRVNSYHHQAVGRVPEALRTVAVAPDGVVEALEARSGAFLLAVEWHPEMSFRRDPEQIAPYRAFAEAVRSS